MAAELAISPATLGRIELNKGCTLHVLIAIYWTTGCSFEHLLGIKRRNRMRQ